MNEKTITRYFFKNNFVQNIFSRYDQKNKLKKKEFLNKNKYTKKHFRSANYKYIKKKIDHCQVPGHV